MTRAGEVVDWQLWLDPGQSLNESKATNQAKG